MALLLTLWHSSAEVVAPYLISATATTDSTTTVTWRNNDLESQRFTMYRGTTATALRAVSNLAGSSRSYSDSGLASSTKYYYAVKAFSAADSSTLSNIDSAITLAAVRILKAPAVRVQWDLSATRITIDVYDSSNCEQGTRVLLSTRTEPERVLTDSVPTRPRSQGLQRFVYSGISPNAWLYLRAESYADTAVRSSPRVAVYTLDLAKLRTSMPQLYLVKKRSEFPIKLKGWAYRAADSIFLTETEAPTDKYSVVNVSNPDTPQFAGYRTIWHPAMAQAGSERYLPQEGRIIEALVNSCPGSSSCLPSLYCHKYSADGYLGSDSSRIVLDNVYGGSYLGRGWYLPKLRWALSDSVTLLQMEISTGKSEHCVLLNTAGDFGSIRSTTVYAGTAEGWRSDFWPCYSTLPNFFFSFANKTLIKVASNYCPPTSYPCPVCPSTQAERCEARALGFSDNDTVVDVWTTIDSAFLAAAYAQPKIRIIGKRGVSGLDPGDFRFGFVDTTQNLAFIVKDTVLVTYDYSDSLVNQTGALPGKNRDLRRTPNLFTGRGLDLTAAIKVTMLDLQGRAISTRTYPNGSRIEIARLQRSKSGIAFIVAEQGNMRKLIPVTMLLVGR